jgi:DNA-binding MarR family transcriptional regulator
VQTTAPAVEQLTDELFAFLTYLVKSAESDVFRVAAELDLALSHLRALFILGHSDHELALSELAQAVGLSVAATGRAVDVLVRHDLVARREDGVDRRIKRIALTAAGRDKLNRLAAARRGGLEQFVTTLSDDERQRFAHALAPILARPDVHAFLQELPQ